MSLGGGCLVSLVVAVIVCRLDIGGRYLLGLIAWFGCLGICILGHSLWEYYGALENCGCINICFLICTNTTRLVVLAYTCV